MAVSEHRLSSSFNIPAVGLGMWQVRGEAACAAAVDAAAEAGYRHFDTAQVYENEQHVGRALAATGIPRNELFITTKIANHNQSWDVMVPSVEASLESLRVDYLDLLLIHFPVTETRRPAWRRIETVLESGLTRSIGVSNYTIRHLEELLRECAVRPVVNQIECHTFLQQPELVRYCQENDILVSAYSPLAHGVGLNNETLAAIGRTHGKTAAQVMLRWCLDFGTVPLPKSNSPDRIRENIDIFDFSLSQSEMQRLQGAESNFRVCWDPTHVP